MRGIGAGALLTVVAPMVQLPAGRLAAARRVMYAVCSGEVIDGPRTMAPRSHGQRVGRAAEPYMVPWTEVEQVVKHGVQPQRRRHRQTVQCRR